MSSEIYSSFLQKDSFSSTTLVTVVISTHILCHFLVVFENGKGNRNLIEHRFLFLFVCLGKSFCQQSFYNFE